MIIADDCIQHGTVQGLFSLTEYLVLHSLILASNFANFEFDRNCGIYFGCVRQLGMLVSCPWICFLRCLLQPLSDVILCSHSASWINSSLGATQLRGTSPFPGRVSDLRFTGERGRGRVKLRWTMLNIANMGSSTPQPPSANDGVHKDRELDENTSLHEGDGKEEGGRDEEFLLLDLEEVFHGAGLPPNIPYTLSGLNTMNPILTLGDSGRLRLIGDYEETTGTCLVFTDHEEKLPPAGTVRPEDGSNQQEPQEEPQQTSRKRISSLCNLDKKLKFRMIDTSEGGGRS